MKITTEIQESEELSSVSEWWEPIKAMNLAIEAARQGKRATITITPEPSNYEHGINGLLKIMKGEEPTEWERLMAETMMPFTQEGGVYT